LIHIQKWSCSHLPIFHTHYFVFTPCQLVDDEFVLAETKNSLTPYTLWVLSTKEYRGTCEDAATMTHVVQWWFFVPGGGAVVVLRPFW
jgi:hypothetical protein